MKNIYTVEFYLDIKQNVWYYNLDILPLSTQQKSKQKIVNFLYDEIIIDGKRCLCRDCCSIWGSSEN